MKLVCISDTHMAEPDLPAGDVLIHAGDLTYHGRPEELNKQLVWLKKQSSKFQKVIIVPGNHDFGFEKDFTLYKNLFEKEGITVLNDSGITVNGVNFWGSPITPTFGKWAFNRDSDVIGVHWDMIPDDTNVLITHGPPKGILDKVPRKVKIGYNQHYQPIYGQGFDNVGCPLLLDAIKARPSIKVHVFGHIHEGYGEHFENDVRFVNPSIMDERYQPVNSPIVITLGVNK